MTYTLKKTDGQELTTILDGQLDTETTSITLIGKNSINFGEPLNENYIKLLENFANVEQPANAIKGQLWYDTSTELLNIYDGREFRNVSGSSRVTLSGSTDGNIVGDSWGSITLSGAKGYILYKIKVSHRAIVKIFTSSAKRLENGTDGVIYTFSSLGEETKIVAPGVIGFNDETPPATEIPIAVYNDNSDSARITVELTLLKIE